MEQKYGEVWLCVVLFASACSSSLLAAAFDHACAVAVGASGLVFGMGAVYIVDMVYNFATCPYPFIRLLGVLLFVVTFLITITSG